MNKISKYLFFLFFITIGLIPLGSSQSFMFGPKGGATFGIQNWNNIKRNPLLAYHGGFFIETYREGANSSFFGSIGYHKRGSSEKAFGSSLSTGIFTSARQPFEFNNSVLILAAKKKINTYNLNKPYYMVGMRLEYTLNTNLDRYAEYAPYFPVDVFVNKFNYGPIAGAGYEFQFSEFVGAFVEATLSPDISKQYDQRQDIPNVVSPYTGDRITIGAQSIRNITLEISIGLRLLRKVTFID